MFIAKHRDFRLVAGAGFELSPFENTDCCKLLKWRNKAKIQQPTNSNRSFYPLSFRNFNGQITDKVMVYSCYHS